MDDGLITWPSPYAPHETLARLLSEVTDRGLFIFAIIDHAQAAKQAGLEMRPASVVIFGNPKGGTPLMQMAPTIAIDLPLKALVWEDENGKTQLTYNRASWIARRHHLAVEDIDEEAWESEGGAIDHHPGDLFASDESLRPTAAPLVAAIGKALADIARSVCRSDVAR